MRRPRAGGPTHPIPVLGYVTSLFCFAKMAASADLRWRYAAAVSTAVAFCSLEITLALLAALPVCCFLFRLELFAGWTRSHWLRFAAVPTAAFAGAVQHLWPVALRLLLSVAPRGWSGGVR